MKVIREETAIFVLNCFLDLFFDDSHGHRRPDFKFKLKYKHTVTRGRIWSFSGMIKNTELFTCNVTLSNESGLSNIIIMPDNHLDLPWIVSYISYDIKDLSYLIFKKGTEPSAATDKCNHFPETLYAPQLVIHNFHTFLEDLDKQDKIKRHKDGREANNK